MNLRGVRESGTLLRDPDLPLHGRDPRHVRLRAAAAAGRRPARGRERRPRRSSPSPGWDEPLTPGRADLPARARLLVRLCGADRRRGDLATACRPSASPRARTPRPRCCCSALIAITMMMSVIVLAKQMGLRYVDPHDLDRLRTADGGAAARRLRPAHGDLPDRRRRSSTTSRRASTSSSPSPASSWCWRPTPPSTASRCSARSSPRTGSRRARSARAATGSPTATASSSSRSWRSS